MRRRYVFGTEHCNRRGCVKFIRTLHSPGLTFHTAILSPQLVYAAPFKKAEYNANEIGKIVRKYDIFDNEDVLSKNVYNISNGPTDELSKNNEKQPEKCTQTIDMAAKNLLVVISDIEFQLGVQSIQKNHFETAVIHFKLATSHQHAGATYNLGLCYEKGLGVERNMKQALECYQAASQLGHSKALFNMGVFHVHGLGGLQRNKKAAYECFVAAAKLGQREAQEALGMLSILNDIREPSSISYNFKMENKINNGNINCQAVAAAI